MERGTSTPFGRRARRISEAGTFITRSSEACDELNVFGLSGELFLSVFVQILGWDVGGAQGDGEGLASPAIERCTSTTCALSSNIDFQVSCERIADRYGMRSRGLPGECFVTHQALAYTLPEDHECFSHLVYFPVRRRKSLPCHGCDSPLSTRMGLAFCGDIAFPALLKSDVLVNEAERLPQTEAPGSSRVHAKIAAAYQFDMAYVTPARALAGFLRSYESPSVAAG